MKTNYSLTLTRTTLLKLVCLLLLVAGFATSVFAQSPEKFNYQAVARDASGNILASKLITIRISILDGGATGAASFVEAHSVTTNQFGLFTLQVGGGTAVSGALSFSNWAFGNEWMKVEMDPNGGTNYLDMGTTQLVSVPYSLVANTAVNMSLNDLNDADGSTATVGQVLKWNGTEWVPSNDIGGTGSGGSYLAGTGISINGSNVISNTGDTDPSNDITNTTTAGGDLGGTYPNPSVDGLQGKPISSTAPTAGQVLKYNGTQWEPGTDNASSGGGSYSGGAGITINGSNVISVDPLAGDITGPTSSTTVSKIQTVSVSSTLPTSGQVLKFNGSQWAPGTDNGGSGGGSYTAGTGIVINGSNVISTSPMGGDVTGTINANVVTKIQTYDVSPNSPSVGEVMKWNGTAWAPGNDNTTGGSTASLWNQSGSNIYNFNGGYVGIGTNNPVALLDVSGSASLNAVMGQFKNINASSTNNVVNISNNGAGYNLYSYKTSQSEAVYFVKDNPGSGTANLYVTNNGTGNSIDAFATGKGYAGGFFGGAQSLGGVYANVSGSGYAAYFDGDISGHGLYAGVKGSGYAAQFGGKSKITFDCTTPSVAHLTIFESSAADYARLNFQNSTNNNYWGLSGMPNSTSSSSKFGIAYSPSGDIITLTGDGNMGIGTTSPTFRLHVYGDASYTGGMSKFEVNNPANTNSVIAINSLASGELITASKSGIGYGINIQKTGTYSSTAAVYGANAGNNGEGVRGSSFGNGGYGVYGNAAGSGTSTYYGVYGYASGSPNADCGIYGVQGAGANDWAGYFSGNLGYTGMLLSTSDARLKTDVKDFTGALQSILSLQPKTYQYRHDGDLKYMNLPEGEQIGLIAQDLEKVLPDLVKASTFTYQQKDAAQDGTDGAVKTTQVDYKGVNYTGLIPVLIGAIQDQQKEIEDLKLRLSRLEK